MRKPIKNARRAAQPIMQGLETRLFFSTTYHVNTLLDETTANSTTSLREAITLANAHPGSKISLDKTGTYNLTNSSVNGTTELDITANVTIYSATGKASSYIIDGNLNGRLFSVSNGADAEIDNVTLQNGLTDEDGGAFLVEDQATCLTLTGDTLNNNTASFMGGAVFQDQDTMLNLSHDTFKNNLAGDNGGAVAYLGASATIYNSTFTSNQSGGSGGGLYVDDISFIANHFLKMAYVTFTGNTASDSGGGVFYDTGIDDILPVVSPNLIPLSNVATLKVVGSSFTGNTAGEEGGGIFVSEFTGELIPQDVVPQDVPDDLLPINVSISGSVFTSNLASVGGGISAEDVNAVNIDSTCFFNNIGGEAGGGIAASDSDLSDGDLTVKITNSTFTGNSAAEGGGIAVEDIINLTVDHTNVSSNRANFEGGGIYFDYFISDQGESLHNTTMTLTNDTISNNTVGGAEGGGGGGVFFFVEGDPGTDTSGIVTTVNISKDTISNNVTGGVGGGIALRDFDPLQQFVVTLISDNIRSNSAAGGGGNIVGVIDQGEGGGISIESDTNTSSTVSMDKDTVAYNRATQSGGGMYLGLNAGTVTMTCSTFNNNISAFEGGGIAIGDSDSATINLTNDTIASNTAASEGGGIYIDDGATLNMTYLTIALNKALFGGGVFNDGAVVSLIDTIIATNTLTSGSPSNGPDVNGNFTDQGHNLIGISDGSTGFTVSTLVGTSASKKDPKLGPLASNGGPSQTMSIPKNGIADNAGTPIIGVPTDQRGVLRSSTAPAIGAYEV